MVRYLRSAALSAAALVLLLATDGSAVRGFPLAYAETASRTPASGHPGSPGHPGHPAHPGHSAHPASNAPVPPPDSAPDAPSAPAAPAAPPTVLPDPGAAALAAGPQTVFTGSAFDTCTAPSLDAMRAWRGASPYGAVGVYTSGRQRGCTQPRLTADWVRQVRTLGWRLIPTHVGRQAPCNDTPNKPQRIDPAQAVDQGRQEAAEAVHGAQRIGIGPGSPVYLDMEDYRGGDPGCAKAVVDFTLGWTQALHNAGYFAGFYSNLDSGVADLAAAARAGAAPLPDAVWYARWDSRTSLDGGGVLTDDQWSAHRRAHQLRGEVTESYGGLKLTLDRDQLDALVAR
ncbi:DUF1906 domain-containing protein [Kitasatospora sp. GAS204B]|uniref:DUF1906 domain-containing protein n=1 Tax=unclassified Kitasatospora TaxID=2633591 RepID=UPI002476CF40|nr:DUF1906 domain-containing protein [Kitasatospora sp. GAS204B]MDH6119436.1 hypothetical protein [Kitasatospora sp. GAS204B]